MARIYESLASLIKPGRISSAATELSETEQKTSSSVDVILPALLARVLKKGNTPEIAEIVREAGKLKMHEDYNQIWDGNAIFDGKNMGVRMENQLLGTENPKFYAGVSNDTGISKEHANRLSTWVAGTIAAFLGEKMAAGRSYPEILSELGGEKDALRKDIPTNIVTILGLGSVLGSPAEPKPAQAPAQKPVTEKKRGMGWLWWLLGILLLALIIFLWCRSCNRDKVEEVAVVTEQVVTAPARQIVTENMPALKEVKRTLGGGQVVTFYENATADYLKAYLGSDKFRNATEAQLKTVWFEFQNIDFEHNSATELQGNGAQMVQNMAAVLKGYPDVKVRIGAFADKTGTRATNFAISEKRAANIKAAFEKAGIDAGRISTEGFGEGFAQVAESATDAQRSPDRDIALRFTK